jgi:acyl transferase domain-containing protein
LILRQIYERKTSLKIYAKKSQIMKAVLALENRTIPPNIKAWPLSSKIPFEKAKLLVASECMPWPAGRHERVSINSFGIGGANGHVIVDSAASYGILYNNVA